MMKFNHKKSLTIQDPSTVTLKQSKSLMIKKLKTYLISRNARKQVAALNTIKHQLAARTSELTAEVLIYTDIPGLLCDVMNNHNPALISQVIGCLLLLSKRQLFFQLKHAAVVVETTCRTLRILSRDAANLTVMYSGLQLLCQTLPSSSKERSVNMASLMGLIEDLLHNPMFQRVHMNVMFLFQTMMKVGDLTYKDIGPVLYEALHLLYKLKTHNAQRFNKYIHLVAEFIRLSLSKVYSSADDKIVLRTKDLIMRLVKFSIVPYMQEVDVQKCHAGFMMRQLNCLLALYQHLGDPELLKMSTFLASKGFLTLLPQFNLHFNGALRSAVAPLLAHILVRLAVATLGCCGDDCQLITTGLTALPVDMTAWPKLLTHHSHAHALAVLVYLYFAVLCAKSFSKSPAYFPALCHYVKHHRSPPSPPLLKSIWLLFAVGSLSSAQVQPAGRVMVQWLRRQTPLTSVYTHHPAILLWSFSVHVTNAVLQVNIMCLWLNDKGKPSLKEIETLALSNRLATFRLLDVVGCCPSDTLPQALLVVQRVLDGSTPERLLEISVHVWTNLAPTLSMLDHSSPGRSRAKNVCCLVWLACKSVPASPDTLMLMRLAYQLLRAFRLPDTEPLLRCQLFKLAHTIAIKMNQAKDYRVLEMFIHDKSLLDALLSSLGCGDGNITLPALLLLSYLQYSQRMYNIQVKGCRSLREGTLLRLMDSPQANTVFACLQLFRSLKPAPTLVALPRDASQNLILTLYLDFLMLTVKTTDSWRCQVMLLDFCKAHNPPLEAHLLTQPWTHLAVQVALRKGGLDSAEVLQFLARWLGALPSRGLFLHTVDLSRALCQDRLSATLTYTAQALLQHKQINGLHCDIASKIIAVGGNVPPEVVKSLKTKIVRESVF